jgi:hypothetical protein
LAFCLANQECKKILMGKMTNNEIYKILFFEKTKLIITKLLCIKSKYTLTKFVDIDFTYPTSSFFAQTNELTSYKNVLTQPDISN